MIYDEKKQDGKADNIDIFNYIVQSFTDSLLLLKNKTMQINIELNDTHFLLGFSLMEFETEIGEVGTIFSIGFAVFSINFFFI